MRRLAVPAIVILASAGALACSPNEGSFKDSAEDFIEDEDGDISAQTGLTYTDASCEEPASTEQGTTFLCSATGSDGQTYDFPAEITGEDAFTLSTPVATGAAPAGSTPPTGASTPTPTTAAAAPATTTPTS